MNQNKVRVLGVFLGFSVFFLIIVGKAFKIQVVDRSELLKRSKSQIFREAKLYPKRGSIYDRNGNPLAINVQTYSIFTLPKELDGDKSSYKELSKIVPELSYESILNKVKDRQRYTWLARKISIDKSQAQKIKNLKGIYIDSVPKRLYPNHEVASQVLGFVGVDNGGLAGIEYLFNDQLKGKPKVVKYVKDAKGRAIKFESQELGSEAHSLTLSIDKELQAYAEKVLKEAVFEHEADKAGFGVMDVQTGEILAMGNYPTFDPNELQGSRTEDRKLAFATDPFEPGSTFKTLTVISAFENKIAKNDTHFYCERGSFQVEDHIINEAESKKHFEWLSVKDILKYSSNIGTTKIAFDLTFPRLRKTLLDFGIGEKTDVEVPGESRGIFTDEENVPPLSLSNISFGQGVATTGVQMLRAYSAVANGGVLVGPTLIKGKITKSRRIFSEETAKEVEKILVEAVEDGTGSKAMVPLFTIAGKTSTAQRVDESGGYKGYVSGFVGYPVNVQDRFVVYVYVDNPKGRFYYGNLVAGPVFQKITQHILLKRKDFNQLTKGAAEKTFSNVDQVRITHSSRYKGRDAMPNFIGLDKRSAMRLAKKLGIKVEHLGIGVVQSQSLEAGEIYRDDKIVKLQYFPPQYD